MKLAFELAFLRGLLSLSFVPVQPGLVIPYCRHPQQKKFRFSTFSVVENPRINRGFSQCTVLVHIITIFYHKYLKLKPNNLCK